MRTVFANAATVRRDWFVVDATDKTLGRLASEVATRLRGKHKAAYTPHVDTGDYIIDARPVQDPVEGAVVSFQLNAEGGRRFRTETARHIKDYMAIVLDDRVRIGDARVLTAERNVSHLELGAGNDEPRVNAASYGLR